MTALPTCAVCAFFRPNPACDDFGQCRRHAPAMHQLPNGATKVRWPIVQADWYCGDHARTWPGADQ